MLQTKALRKCRTKNAVPMAIKGHWNRVFVLERLIFVSFAIVFLFLNSSFIYRYCHDRMKCFYWRRLNSSVVIRIRLGIVPSSK